MKILNKEEAGKLKLSDRYSRKPSEFTLNLRKLNVGQGLLILKSEWKKKTPAPALAYQTLRIKRTGVKVSCRTLADGDGWLITRIK